MECLEELIVMSLIDGLIRCIVLVDFWVSWLYLVVVLLLICYGLLSLLFRYYSLMLNGCLVLLWCCRLD